MSGTQTAAAVESKIIECRLHESGFELSDSNFYSLTIASDGSVYYTLCCHNIDTHGRVYRYDPQTDEVRLICDLGEACGETGLKTLPQGKSHSPFYELDGWLYLSTHYGYFATTDQREEPAPVPEGYKPYRGGHILRINMADGRVEDLAIAPPEEGILTLNMDRSRKMLYGLTWGKGHFLTYDIAKGELRDLGPACRGGECGRGDQYFCLVRTFAIDPRDGNVYFTNPDGQVQVYRPGSDRVEPFGEVTLKCDIMGFWDPHKPGHQGYNWRDILWHDGHQCFYGVHPRSGWLFRFDPHAQQPVELIERIAAEELRRNGRFEPFRYGYLSLQLGPDGRTLYYLTSTYGLTAEDGRQVREATHLVTYDLESGKYADHGMLRLEDGRYPRMSQCHAVHPNGKCYTAPWIETSRQTAKGRPVWQCDLISFDNPLV